MERLLYISKSRIEHMDAAFLETEIVGGSRIKNATLDLTGALLFTGTYFAQILEGSAGSIDQLMFSIHGDLRHDNILVVDRSSIDERKFPDWKMAYFGPSQFVSRHVVRLLTRTSQSEQRRATEWLTELAYEFASH